MKSLCLILSLFGSLAFANQPNTQRAEQLFQGSAVVLEEMKTLEDKGFVCGAPSSSVLFMVYGDEGFISKLNVSSVCSIGQAPATLAIKVVAALVTLRNGPEIEERIELINPLKISELSNFSR